MIFTFEIRPMAKQSVRMGNGFAYQPKDVVNYHNYLKIMAQQQMGQSAPYAVPLRVKIIAQYKLPKSAKKDARSLIASGFSLPKPTKPDIDNLTKATLDPLNGVVWTDDALICEAMITKRWGDRDLLIISVEEI